MPTAEIGYKQRWTPHYGYSTNVHRGETLAQIYRYLNDFTFPVRDRVFPGQKAGAEIRLGIHAARELSNAKTRRNFAAFLEANGLYIFSINAYPLLNFHARRVKEKVYKPSWAEADRCRWTNTVADVFAHLLPEGIEGSLSTLGGAFRRDGHGPKIFKKLARNYLKSLEKLASIEKNTGKTIVLAAEPEPETTFENARDVIEFFEGYLIPTARDAGYSLRQAEKLLYKFFTVNFDTCHFSVLFEDLVKNLRALARAGIRVGKLHVTNAIALTSPARRRVGFAEFRGMDEPRYFHQFCARDAAGKVVWRDLDLDYLPPKLDRAEHADIAELRSHYHVPLHLKRWRRLETTQAETRDAVREVLRTRVTSHLVIETYTWPILAAEETLVQGITREFRWLLKEVEAFAG